MTDASLLSSGAADIFRRILGKQGYSEDLARRELMSKDVWSKGALADFVASPDSVESLRRTIAAPGALGIR